jgi:predicted dehydrogenase
MSVENGPLGIALVGCGRISASHLAAIAAQPVTLRLIATVDHGIERAREAAAPFGAVAFATLDEAMLLPEVEAVIVCSPNAAHVRHACTALEAGRHVLVEKPLAETSAEAAELADLAERKGLALVAGHTFRHGPAVRYLQDHMAEFGRLRAVEVSQCMFWDGPQAPWWAERTPEQGLILSMFAPHPLDFIQLVMGADDPLRVHAEGARHQDGWQAEDEVMAVMAYPDRRMVSLHISYNQRPVHDRKVLFFENGVLEIVDSETLSWNGEVRVSPAPGTMGAPGKMGGRDLSFYFRTQLSEFARATKGLPHRCATGRDAARLTALLEWVLASVRAHSVDAIDPRPIAAGVI